MRKIKKNSSLNSQKIIKRDEIASGVGKDERAKEKKPSKLKTLGGRDDATDLPLLPSSPPSLYLFPFISLLQQLCTVTI
jgi:hypothetical protein